MFAIVFIGLEEGLKFLPLVIAACILFRLAHFPDMGIGGSFALGAAAIAFSTRYAFPPFAGVMLACLLGAIGGFSTGVLFVKFHLNSLLCGIITALGSYSICYNLLGREPSAAIPSFISEIWVGVIGLMLICMLCIFFSSRFGLVMRMSGESPKLLQQLGLEPRKNLLMLLILGNLVSGMAGALVVGVKANVNLHIGDGKLFQSLISLIWGEGILSVLIALTKSLNKHNTIKVSSRLTSLIKNISGTGALYSLSAAIIGSLTYWIVYNVCNGLFGAGADTQIILATMTAFLLIIASKISNKFHRLSAWSFLGDLS